MTGACTLLSVIALLSAALAVWDARNSTIASYSAEEITLGTVLADETRQSVEAIDRPLTAIRDVVAERGIHDPSLTGLLERRIEHLPQVVAFAAIDSDGHVTAKAGDWPAGPDIVAVSPKSDPAGGTAINADEPSVEGPLRSASDGAPLMLLTRPVIAPDGSKVGRVVAAASLRALTRRLGNVKLDFGSSITLLRFDGTVLLHSPDGENLIGMRLPEDADWHGIVARGGGLYRWPGDKDAGPRLVSVHRLGGYDLVLDLSVPEADCLAPWRRQAMLLGLGSGVTVLALLVLFALLDAQFRRFARSEAVLAQHNAALEANATRLASQTAELRDTAAALRRSESESAEKSRLLETTLEAITQGIIMVTADGMVVVCNARAVALLELPDWLVAERFKFADLVAYQWASGEFDNADPSMLDMLRNLRLGEHPQVYVRRRPNGTVLEIRSRKLPDGSTVRTFSDITAHKEAEERAEAARAQAEQANRAKSDFLANISHEIRTPMNGVIGMNEVLMRTELTDAQRECVQTIRVSAEALLAVINDVLDLSRLEAGKMDLEQIPFDLVEILEGAVSMLRPRAAEKALTLSSTIAPGVARHVTGDPVRLRQVLLNLLGNAVKFTETGSVDLTLDLAPSDGVRITVSDTGIGMGPATLERLFQKFTQADNSISRRFGGSGLGLAISKELVTLMGGTIAVRSAPGAGSQFIVTLPLLPVPFASLSGSSRAPQQCGPAFAPLHVLVVDDNAINRRLVTVLLQDAGHRVDVATNGREAVEAAVSVRYDAILMDVQMPVMNGVQATRRIRALPAPFNAVPVIALTADALSDASQRYQQAGMDAYLSKPLSTAALLSTLDSLARGGRPSVSAAGARPVDGSTLTALRGFLAPEAFHQFIHEALADVGARLDRLEELLAAGDLAAAAQAAHDLVSIAGHCGAHIVSGMARDLEQACRDTAAEPLSADALRTAWGRAAELLEAATADLSAA